jgi:hypothetical protein
MARSSPVGFKALINAESGQVVWIGFHLSDYARLRGLVSGSITPSFRDRETEQRKGEKGQCSTMAVRISGWSQSSDVIHQDN